MLIDVSDNRFLHIMNDEFFWLPKRWDGKLFEVTIQDLYKKYKRKLKPVLSKENYSLINSICDGIELTLNHYFKGFPFNAYNKFNEVMQLLISNPLKMYQKSGFLPLTETSDQLKLFRIRNVENNILYSRKDIFHTPYDLRSKVSSCRYSLAGYPSLYLGTSLELCSEEVKIKTLKDLRIASRFEIIRDFEVNSNNIKVIEMAVKPQDFLNYNEDTGCASNLNAYSRRIFYDLDLNDKDVSSNYMYWYPLIAACSFIRVNKDDAFAAEYIIPQLLMQWTRSQSVKNELYGIRYFSSSSERASNLGFNYVFPVSGEENKLIPKFCSALVTSFSLTKPKYIHEFNSLEECEVALIEDVDLKYVYNR